MQKDSASPESLVIRNVEFIGGKAEQAGWRPDSKLPEIAFAGPSNVGKSSLLNNLVRRKSFARVSKTPGRTREINFFRVNNQFLFVDLPGYGYARISKEKKASWRPLIESYLGRTPQLRGLVLLLDIRREPRYDDRAMLDLLARGGIPTLVARTKSDKVSKAAVQTRVDDVSRALSLDTEQIIPFSVVTGQGRTELLEAIMQLVAPAPQPTSE